MSISFWQKYSNYFGIIGFFLGGYSGFIMRDEYNFSSVKKIDDLLENFQENSRNIQESRDIANNHIQKLVKKPPEIEVKKEEESNSTQILEKENK